MTRILRYIGGAGVGKTTTLLNTMADLIASGWSDPYGIGFVSFTRAAREEAASRAAERFDVRQEDLERSGWFRTWHSVCYRQLGVGDALLAPGRATVKWLEEALQESVGGTGEQTPDDEFGTQEKFTRADAALQLWGLARSRMVPLQAVYERAWALSPETPDLRECIKIIERYEQAKRLDSRYDFTDLLSQFAGVRPHIDGPRECPAVGAVPDVRIWFLDEAQDNTPLIDRVARRVTEAAELVYLVGDPFQSIHTWAGADHRLFQAWPAERQKILDRSYRCPSEILDLGERCLRGCSDYWDRGIQPNRAGGQVDWCSGEEWVEDLDPAGSWLLLSRTNFQAKRLMAIVKNAGLPWRPIKGNGGWAAPERQRALEAMLTLEQGEIIDANQWSAILKYLPSAVDKQPLLERGAKAAWSRGEYERPDPDDNRKVATTLIDWGATRALMVGILEGRWAEWIDNGVEFRTAQRIWGWGAVMQPGIRIGTIHSAKGMEADNVVWHLTTSKPVQMSAEYDQAGKDEECRLGYVAATRARHRLIINEERTQYRMEVPA